MSSQGTDKMTLKEMFDKSLEKWGFNSQLLMIAEEASELSVASLHMTRNTKNATEEKRDRTLIAFANELVDVQFMIEEFVYYLKDKDVGGITFFELLTDIRRYKEKRLQDLLRR